MKPKFFEIFSSKKIKRKEVKRAKILVDYREKNCLIGTELFKAGFEVEFKELKVADYLVKGIAIERKTIQDFISSMINKRLTKQLQELQQYKKRLLIIEGYGEQEIYNDKNLNGVSANAIRGFLLSIVLSYNTPLIFSKNYKDTARFIEVLAKKKKTETPLNVSKRNLNKNERMQFILESFPGIGPKTAKKLLNEFKTIKEIFNTPQEKLAESIGKKAEVFKIIEEHYK